jgi:hypothetical protein
LLYKETIGIAAANRVQYFLVRGENLSFVPFDRQIKNVRTVIELDDGEESLWSTISSNTRRKIRKARRNGFSVEEHSVRLKDYYPIYARRLNELGTPPMGPGLFRGMEKYLKPHLRFYSVLKDNKMVGGMIAIASGKTITSLYVAVESHLFRLYPTYLLYWFAIQKSYQNGFSLFDLGRSIPGSGNHRFKQQWGGIDHYIGYFYFRTDASNKSSRLDGMALHRETSLKQRIWTKLPNFFANLIGPYFRRQLPFG